MTLRDLRGLYDERELGRVTCVESPVLSPEDYASIHHAGQALAGRYGVVTLNAMLEAWAFFVEDVEDGFDADSAFEYRHDVQCRDWLAEAWPMLTETVRSLREAELRELDARYLSATVPLLGVGADRAEPGGGRWWRHRRPRLVEGGEVWLPPGW
ncbi:hypothetical protein [Streptomyces sp. 46]|uniref:hypothetical protein n=1 Tax=Streptomyces sp. 46 TaxID=1777322 RepID=UPI00142F00A0|nr:hypothetical protein [Streptomyces sp. 46]